MMYIKEALDLFPQFYEPVKSPCKDIIVYKSKEFYFIFLKVENTENNKTMLDLLEITDLEGICQSEDFL